MRNDQHIYKTADGLALILNAYICGMVQCILVFDEAVKGNL